MSTIRLITGGIGCGKTLFIVDELFKLKNNNPDRLVYTDITGLRHSGILQAPDDWRDVPDNSLIVYDEVQYRELFSRHNSKRDKQILDLTTIRKRGIDMWLITQRARFLNPDVLGLVNEHYHVERNGQYTSKIFVFQEAETNITKTKKLMAFDRFVYQHNQDLFPFYESIKQGAKHNKRNYTDKRVVTLVITIIIALIALYFFISKSFDSAKSGFKFSESIIENKDSSTIVTSSSNSISSNQKVVSAPVTSSISDEQQSSAPILSKQITSQAIAHNKVYSSKWDFVSGCAIADNSCKCYSYNASIVRDVTDKECREYIKGYKPLVSHSNATRDNVIYEDFKSMSDIQKDEKLDNGLSSSSIESN